MPIRTLAWKADRSHGHSAFDFSLQGCLSDHTIHPLNPWDSICPPYFVGVCVKVCFDGKYDKNLYFHSAWYINEMY